MSILRNDETIFRKNSFLLTVPKYDRSIPAATKMSNHEKQQELKWETESNFPFPSKNAKIKNNFYM